MEAWTTMSNHEAIAMEFITVLNHPSFRVLTQHSYTNKFGVHGIRWEGEFNNQKFYCSESNTTTRSEPVQIAEILSDKSNIDFNVDPVYFADRRNGLGYRIEARKNGRWIQVFTP